MGTARPMPTKTSSLVGLMSAVTMPTTWPSRLSSGPPELPGLTAASTWIRPWRTGPSASRLDRPVEAGDDARAHRGVQPERIADDEGLAADLDGVRVAERGRARSWREACRAAGPRCRWRGRVEATLADDSVPSANVTLIDVAPLDDVKAGQDVARWLTITPLPRPLPLPGAGEVSGVSSGRTRAPRSHRAMDPQRDLAAPSELPRAQPFRSALPRRRAWRCVR